MPQFNGVKAQIENFAHDVLAGFFPGSSNWWRTRASFQNFGNSAGKSRWSKSLAAKSLAKDDDGVPSWGIYMKYRNFRGTDLRVSEVGFGLWTVSTGWGTFTDDEAVTLMRQALDLGVTLYDAADTYGNGRQRGVDRQGLSPAKRSDRDRDQGRL